jgi:hypothetical protein
MHGEAEEGMKKGLRRRAGRGCPPHEEMNHLTESIQNNERELSPIARHRQACWENMEIAAG